MPDWFTELFNDVAGDLDAAYAGQQQIIDRRNRANTEYEELAPVVEQARQATVGPQQEINHAYEQERAAQQRLYAANNDHLRAGGWLERRRTERAAVEAKAEHQQSTETLQKVREQHRPVIDRHQQLAAQLERHRTDRGITYADRYTPDPAVIEQQLDALGTWHDWATGKHVTQQDLAVSVTVLRDVAVDRGQDWEIRQQYQELAGTLTNWAKAPEHQIRLPEPPQLRIRGPEIDFGIGL